jgi:hypothetical protein
VDATSTRTGSDDDPFDDEAVTSVLDEMWDDLTS